LADRTHVKYNQIMSLFTRKWILLLVLAFSVCAVYAQGDVVIIGKIDNPPSQFVSIHYKKNLFSLEEGVFEARLNQQNTFSVKVKLPEPRAVYLNYNNNKLKLFLVPNDTLKLHFKGSDMVSTVAFEGLAALPNKYLAKAVKQFPDMVDEKKVQQERLSKSPREYQTFVDNLYFEKRRFFENYPTEDKDYFTSDFLDYAANDITYWRTYQLMMYYKQYGLNNKDNTRFIDDNYFNFLFDTENVFYKALNNDYYLQFLELYLTYIRERDSDKYGKTNLDAVEERSRQVQIVKPKDVNIWLLEDPFASKKLLASLGAYDEVEYLHLITDAEFEFTCETVTYKDVYIKVQTKDGVKGWVPQKLITMTDRSVSEKTVFTRQCFTPGDPLCGFSTALHGKVLYYASLRDILFSFLTMPYPDMQKQLNAYSRSNSNFEDYNKILKEAYEVTLKNRDKGGDKIYIPQSCFVDELNQKDKPSPVTVKPVVADVVPEKTTIEGEKPQPAVADAPKPLVPIPQQPKLDEKPKAAERIVEKTAEKPKTQSEMTVVNTPTGVNITVSPKAVSEEKPKAAEKIAEKPVENAVKSVEKSAKNELPKSAVPEKAVVAVPSVPKETEQPTTPPQTATTDNSGFKLVNGDRKVDLNTEQEIVPWNGMLDYKPDGKPVIFNGLVINDNVPIFKLTDVNGKEVGQQDLLGKIVVIDFWASWCGPCQAQLTHSKKLADKYKDDNVVFVFISMDADQEAWKTALKEKNLPGIQANDKIIIPINFSIQGLPNVFIVGKNGKVAYNSMLKSPVTDEKMIEILLKSQ
jgi:thiol-disulfide isomerase/thioredoxin